ncbi:MAG: hypothetical protein HY074_00325 [Deltaproteobacteria bacterium]|nr:hypothetical protein [Deltaproteobacteria bacterium]
MSAPASKHEVLLAINLEMFTQHQAAILPIIAECGGHQIGSVSNTYVAGFPANADGVVNAVSCAQRLQLALPSGSSMIAAIHVGDVQGEGLKTLLAIRKVTGLGGISMSQTIVDLGQGRLPIALEPLETSKGPTEFLTMVKTRFIEMAPKAPTAGAEKTNSKMIYAQTSGQTSGNTKLLMKPARADDETFFQRAYGQAKSNFAIVGGGMFFLIVAGLNLTSSQHLVERGKSFILSGTVGRALAEKTAKIDAQIAATGAAMIKPIDMAKKAAEQASAVNQDLLDLAPEIKREDVMGKPRGAAVANEASAAASPGSTPAGAPGPAAVSGTAPVPASAPAHVTRFENTAAPVAREESAPAPIIEETLFSKCVNDGEFCFTTGSVFYKEGAFSVAIRFLNKGCDLNVAKSCSLAAQMYTNGQGVEKSETTAKGLLAKSCIQNDAAACTEVGLAYLQGKGFTVSVPRAREALDRGCTLGHATACLILGISAQAPPEGTGTRTIATSAENLAKGCALMKPVGCGAATGNFQETSHTK